MTPADRQLLASARATIDRRVDALPAFDDAPERATNRKARLVFWTVVAVSVLAAIVGSLFA